MIDSIHVNVFSALTLVLCRIMVFISKVSELLKLVRITWCAFTAHLIQLFQKCGARPRAVTGCKIIFLVQLG